MFRRFSHIAAPVSLFGRSRPQLAGVQKRPPPQIESEPGDPATSSSSTKTNKRPKNTEPVATVEPFFVPMPPNPPTVFDQSPSLSSQAVNDQERATQLNAAPAQAEPEEAAIDLPVNKKVQRSFRMANAMSRTGEKDFALAKQDGDIFSFFVFPKHSVEEVAKWLLAVPLRTRTFHSIVGRNNIPCDFYADVDVPLEVSIEEAERNIANVIRLVKAKVESRRHKIDKVVLLTGNSPSRHSFHLHVRLQNSAFADYRAVAEMAHYVNENLPHGSTGVDTGVYRNMGTMRCAANIKTGETSRKLEPYKPRYAEIGLAELLTHATLTDLDTVMLSLAIRPELIGKSRLMKASAVQAYSGPDKVSNGYSRYLSEDKRQERVNHALFLVRRLPNHVADDYDTWINIGLACYALGGSTGYDTWLHFSQKCPQKFEHEVCQNAWQNFPKYADSTWQRSFCYVLKVYMAEMGFKK